MHPEHGKEERAEEEMTAIVEAVIVEALSGQAVGNEDQDHKKRKGSLTGKSQSAGSSVDDESAESKRKKVWRVMLTPEQAKGIYLRRPSLDEVHGKYVYTHGSMRNARIVAKKYDVSAKTIRDIWNRYSWAKVTRPLWTPQEAQHYANTYPVRGHQGMALVQQQHQQQQNELMSRGIGYGMGGRFVNGTMMGQCDPFMDPMGSELQQNGMHISLMHHQQHQHQHQQHQQQIVHQQNFSLMPASSSGGRSFNTGMVGHNPNLGFSVAPRENWYGAVSAVERGSLCRTSSHDSLYLGGEKMRAADAEIDQMVLKNPLGSAALGLVPKESEKGDMMKLVGMGDCSELGFNMQSHLMQQVIDMQQDLFSSAVHTPPPGRRRQQRLEMQHQSQQQHQNHMQQHQMPMQSSQHCQHQMQQDSHQQVQQQQQQQQTRQVQPDVKYLCIDKSTLQREIDSAQRRLNELLVLQQNASKDHQHTAQKEQKPPQSIQKMDLQPDQQDFQSFNISRLWAQAGVNQPHIKSGTGGQDLMG